MSLVRLTIQGISYSQTQTGAYALVLKEQKGERKLPIVIGAFEAQSIAIAMESEIKPPRPLTHDLFKNFATRFDITVKQVIIHKLVDGVFYSSLICERDGIEEMIDARTSDAVALALRFEAPIFTYKEILDQAGILTEYTDTDFVEEDNNEEETEQEIEEFFESILFDENEKPTPKELTIAELEEKLNQAVADEDYEKAAKIRDEITKKKTNN